MAEEAGGKLPGKTQFSGRRRITTRKSGFNSHPDATGGEFKIEKVPSYKLAKDEVLKITFTVPNKLSGISAFGGWYTSDGELGVQFEGIEVDAVEHTSATYPNWGKFGSMWLSKNEEDTVVVVKFRATEEQHLSLYLLNCGIVTHKHLEWARLEKPVLLSNMYIFAPEANFVSVEGEVEIDKDSIDDFQFDIYTKSCNRCARFLPFNVDNERIQLSFSNHCVAEHRRPCQHTGFGKLRNVDTEEVLNLDYGYQLECRYCKKFEVNAAHNPQRTSAQMKEDAARRRAIELLLTELYGGSHQMKFRHEHDGLELSDYIWEKFDHKCFNCGKEIENSNQMHLDHTRPLALLWPLDETATCLCGNCNSQKRARSPVEFYDEAQIVKLSEIAGIPVEELLVPGPNMEAVDLLLERLDWFFNDFINKPELTKERDGKVAAELLVKALQKTLSKCPDGAPLDLVKEYEKRLA